ncbi:hypothetical protein BST99_11630 [Aureicoccus marinus]|uniref:Uncharacterized protein n=1 Tax=Aureicoccus marinus TaxID=754435 RepID=A0A2S7T8M6_9FLAO|nr:hypothetical protein BST99_11630 [Aureicoccus marinus]
MGIIREFNVSNSVANSNLYFDLQTNIKMKTAAFYDVDFKFQRLKMPIDEIPMNKELFFLVKAPGNLLNEMFIGFKVERR